MRAIEILTTLSLGRIVAISGGIAGRKHSTGTLI